MDGGEQEEGEGLEVKRQAVKNDPSGHLMVVSVYAALAMTFIRQVTIWEALSAWIRCYKA